MELYKFIDLFMPYGDAYVVYWDIDSEKDEMPLWTGSITDTPYWIARGYKIARYDNEWDSVIDMRNLGEKYGNRVGLVITLVCTEE